MKADARAPSEAAIDENGKLASAPLLVLLLVLSPDAVWVTSEGDWPSVNPEPQVPEREERSELVRRPGTSVLTTLIASLTQSEQRSVFGMVLFERPPPMIVETTFMMLFSESVPTAPWMVFNTSVMHRLFEVEFFRQTTWRTTG